MLLKLFLHNDEHLLQSATIVLSNTDHPTNKINKATYGTI